MLVGNLLEQAGVLGRGVLAGDRPDLYATTWWQLLNIAAIVAAILLAAVLGGSIGLVVRSAIVAFRARRRAAIVGRIGTADGLLAVFALGYGLGMGTWGLVVIMFDRYLWLLALPLAILLLRPSDQPATALVSADDLPDAADPVGPRPAKRRAIIGWLVAGALTVALALTSGLLLLSGDAFEAARWRMGTQAVALGVPANEVDAGLEWVAFHASGDAAPYATGPDRLSRYVYWWPGYRICAMVSATRLTSPGFQLLAADPAAYRKMLFVGRQEPLYLYRVPDPGCQ
jgi:hypothetical protein